MNSERKQMFINKLLDKDCVYYVEDHYYMPRFVRFKNMAAYNNRLERTHNVDVDFDNVDITIEQSSRVNRLHTPPEEFKSLVKSLLRKSVNPENIRRFKEYLLDEDGVFDSDHDNIFQQMNDIDDSASLKD